jgi:hypothetical protein
MHLIAVCSTPMLAIAFLDGCTAVPSIDIKEESIRIIDLIKRIKCDMYYAVSVPKQTKSGVRLVPISTLDGYEWMTDWVIQVNLNLLVNEQSGISPGAMLIDPLKQMSLPGVGTFPQSYSTGLGAGINTTASRTESISFSISLKEIEKELGDRTSLLGKYHDCILKNGTDLDSDLKLKEWVWSSLAPVGKYLTVGHHKTPKPPTLPAQSSVKAPTSTPGSAQLGANLLVEKLQDLVEAIRITIDLMLYTRTEELAGGNTPVAGAVSDETLKNLFHSEEVSIRNIDEAIGIIKANPDNSSIDNFIG